jgi:hypothetical protein
LSPDGPSGPGGFPICSWKAARWGLRYNEYNSCDGYCLMHHFYIGMYFLFVARLCAIDQIIMIFCFTFHHSFHLFFRSLLLLFAWLSFPAFRFSLSSSFIFIIIIVFRVSWWACHYSFLSIWIVDDPFVFTFLLLSRHRFADSNQTIILISTEFDLNPMTTEFSIFHLLNDYLSRIFISLDYFQEWPITGYSVGLSLLSGCVLRPPLLSLAFGRVGARRRIASFIGPSCREHTVDASLRRSDRINQQSIRSCAGRVGGRRTAGAS